MKVTSHQSIQTTRVTAITLTTVVAALTIEAAAVIEATIEAIEVAVAATEAIIKISEGVKEVAAPGGINNDSLVISTISKLCKIDRIDLLITITEEETEAALTGLQEEVEATEAVLVVNMKTRVKILVRKKLALNLHSTVINQFNKNEKYQFSLCV